MALLAEFLAYFLTLCVVVSSLSVDRSIFISGILKLLVLVSKTVVNVQSAMIESPYSNKDKSHTILSIPNQIY